MRSRARSLLRGALWAVPVVVTVTDCVASIIRVDGASMQPTLNPAGGTSPDYVLVEKLTIKLLQHFTRGEVVVLWAPDNPHQQIIKRLLALEGDTLLELGEGSGQQQQQQGGQPHSSSSSSSGTSSSSSSPGDASSSGPGATAAPGTVDIPQGRCWVEGDNSARSASSADSRTAFGPVHLGLLEGRVSHIVWPPSRVGRVAVAPQPQRVLEADSGAWEAGDG